MDGRIGHLHCRVLRTAGESASTASLERAARERVGAALGEALEPTFGADPTVYVLRSMRAGLALSSAERTDDDALGRRLAERLAATVTHALATGDDGAGDLVRFADQAEFVARFANDLVAGSAWEAWFYGAFGALRPLGTAGALRAVLLEHRDLLPAILVWLRRHDGLEGVLAALDEATQRLLLDQGAEEDAVRPLLSAALRLLDGLGRLAAGQPDPVSLLECYLATRPARVSWHDRRALAEGVLDAVGFLVAERCVAPTPRVAAAGPPAPLPAAPFAGVDWLDAEWLRARLGEVLGGAHSRAVVGAGMPRRALTPARRLVLAELEEILAQGQVALDLTVLDSPANALRLTAAFAARAPRGPDADVVAGVIAGVLRTAARRRPEVSGLAATAVARVTRDRQALRAAFLRDGVDAAEAGVLAELAAGAVAPAGATRSEPAVGPAQDGALATPCAGALLLARAMLDLRMPALGAACGYPERAGFSALALALAVRWGGPEAVALGRVDPALAQFAGAADPPAADDLDVGCDPGSPGGQAFERALLGALARHGLVGGPRLVVHRLAIGEQRAIVAGPEGDAVWPLMRVTTGGLDEAALLEGWRKDWEIATGTRPALRAAKSSDALLAALGAVASGDRSPLGSAAPALDLMALAVLRAWARWLRGFDAAGAPYLFDHFVRRPGHVLLAGGELIVCLEPRPLDVVLEMAGYLDEIDAASTLGWRMRFVVAEG